MEGLYIECLKVQTWIFRRRDFVGVSLEINLEGGMRWVCIDHVFWFRASKTCVIISNHDVGGGMYFTLRYKMRVCRFLVRV